MRLSYMVHDVMHPPPPRLPPSGRLPDHGDPKFTVRDKTYPAPDYEMLPVLEIASGRVLQVSHITSWS